MKNDTAARIGIIAADPLRSLGLEAILDEISGLQAVPLTLATLAAEPPVAAILLDARAAAGPLADLLARLRREHPSLKLVVIGESLAPEHVQAVIGAGAKGYLPETANEEDIRMALEIVLDGSVWAPRKVLARLIEAGGVQGTQAAAGNTEPVASLMTPREMEVLNLLKDGRTNRDIARAMGIDETTVKAHLGRMLRKTGATNRVELTLRAMDERE